LPLERLEKLLRLVTTPTSRRRSERCFETRIGSWCAVIDEAARSITLSAADIAWVQQQIRKQRFGGLMRRS
jgi:hypothetical protein